MKVTDHKIQIYLDDGLYRKARQAALAKGESLASVVRESLEAYVASPSTDAIRQGYAKLDRLIGLISDAPDAAKRHDEYAWKKDW